MNSSSPSHPSRRSQAKADSSYSPAAIDPDLSRRSQAEAEEIRRVIAWVLCDAMPPNDERLRTIYADDVTLDSLAAHHDERCQIGALVYQEFDVVVSLEDTAAWQTVGDIIRFVQSKIPS